MCCFRCLKVRHIASQVLRAQLCTLVGRGELLVPGTTTVVRSAPGFCFFATQNDASYANRKRLGPLLRNRFLEAQVGKFSSAEIRGILQTRFGKDLQPFTSSRMSLPVLVAQLEAVFSNVNKAIEQRALSLGDVGIELTMRELIKWIRRAALAAKDAPVGSLDVKALIDIGFSMLSGRMRTREDKERLADVMKTGVDGLRLGAQGAVSIAQGAFNELSMVVIVCRWRQDCFQDRIERV